MSEFRKQTIKYEIEEHIGTISEESGSQWSKELNLVSWSSRKPTYDIRSWTDDHEKMSKGVSLTRSEAENLYHLLKRIFE